MDYILFICSFVITLFVYIHVCFHLKKNNDLEIYDIPFENKETFHEILDIRQPTKINNLNQEFYSNAFHIFSLKLENILKKKGENKINIFSYQDYLNKNLQSGLSYACSKYFTLLKSENNKDENKYFSKDNQAQLIEWGIHHMLDKMSLYLQPELSIKKDIDLWIKPQGTISFLEYSYHNRYYLMIQSGFVKLRCIPPKYKNILYERSFFNTTTLNVWDKDFNDKHDIQYLDIDLQKGDVFYIPPYWSYSMYANETSYIFTYKYDTVMSMFVSSPYYVMNKIDNMNTKVKRVSEKNIVTKNYDNTIDCNHDDIKIENIHLDVSINDIATSKETDIQKVEQKSNNTEQLVISTSIQEEDIQTKNIEVDKSGIHIDITEVYHDKKSYSPS